MNSIFLEDIRGVGRWSAHTSGNFLKFLREKYKLLIRYIT
jgi:hypothetical protein